MKGCMRMVNRNNMQIIWTFGLNEGRQGEYEWRMSLREGGELDVKKMGKIDRPRSETCRIE